MWFKGLFWYVCYFFWITCFILKEIWNKLAILRVCIYFELVFFLELKVQPFFNWKGRSHELVTVAKPNFPLLGPKSYFCKNRIGLYYILRVYFIFKVDLMRIKEMLFCFWEWKTFVFICFHLSRVMLF